MATSNGTEPAAEFRCDALVVGAGFSGVSMLYRLRKLGLKARIFEAGADFGGTWYWNRYPGARVDSEFPFYQLNIPELYNTWTFRERFPDHHELRAYFAHADKVLGLAADTTFHARVNGCAWDDVAGEWTVRTAQGHVAKARFLLLCTGLLHSSHTPAFPGLAAYQGQVHHSAHYPPDLALAGKRVALVGAGATAVQITQEAAKQAAHLTLLQRRPSLCLPAQQRAIAPDEAAAWRAMLPQLLAAARATAGGFFVAPPDARATRDVPAADRERLWRALCAGGGFRFMAMNFSDVMVDKEANALVYEFWARQVRARMTDAFKMDQMAPLPADKMPYYIFTKRPPLEVDYYECVDRPSVDVVNTTLTPVKEFNATGLLMEDGRQIDFDVLILATGFDAFSGSLANMGLKGRGGLDIKDYWQNGIRAYLGVTTAGFPNAFQIYTPMAPTALANGTTIIELQSDFICAMIRKMLDSDSPGAGTGARIKSIEALASAEDEWAAYIEAQAAPTLYPLTHSWWTGANIPGKKTQMLTYLRGLDAYEKEIRERLERLEGFDVRYWDDGPQQAAPVPARETPLAQKADKGPVTEHVENVEQNMNGAGDLEADQILRPTASA